MRRQHVYRAAQRAGTAFHAADWRPSRAAGRQFTTVLTLSLLFLGCMPRYEHTSLLGARLGEFLFTQITGGQIFNRTAASRD